MTFEEMLVVINSSDVKSFINDDDLYGYYKFANLFNNGTIVDLGTGWGKSLMALSLANLTNQVITCDTGTYPIVMHWAEDEVEYTAKIQAIIVKYSLNVQFFLEPAEDLIKRDLGLVDLVHIDNWVEINNVDTSEFLKQWVNQVKKGGYILTRNYGHGDRQPYTDSVDKALVGCQKLEARGLITIWQK